MVEIEQRFKQSITKFEKKMERFGNHVQNMNEPYDENETFDLEISRIQQNTNPDNNKEVNHNYIRFVLLIFRVKKYLNLRF